MNEERRRRARRQLADHISKEWADKGCIVAGGWHSFVATTLQDAGPVQLAEMRKAYYIGAQHLFATLANVMDADREPTERDIRTVMLVHEELEAFRIEMGATMPPGPLNEPRGPDNG